MRRTIICHIALLGIFAGCTDPSSGFTHDLRWVGSVTPEDPAACGPATQGTLTRRANAITFAPNDGVLVLIGTIHPDGNLQGTLALTGADHHPYPLALTGKLAPDGFQGLYTTPRCKAQVVLRPVP